MHKTFVEILFAVVLTLPGLAVAAGTVQLPATGQTACFAANGSPRACAGTGEDGEKGAGAAWPLPRFSDNGNGTVTDNLTGLIWSKHANAPSRALPGNPNNGCPNAENDMIWLDALDFISCLNTRNHAGFSDWRLPNLHEMESVVNAGVANSAAYLNANGFGFGPGLPSEVRASQYWTSTSDESSVASPDLSAAAAWDVDLVKGDFPFSTLKNGQANAVWPVRGVSTGTAKLWMSGQTLCFDDIGAPRPCPATGEDGEKLAGTAWPAPRFKPNTDATFALDRLSGLLWAAATQTPGPPACADTGLNLNWQQALSHVACLNTNAFLGRTDWRLPNRKELRSLVDYSRGAPALPAGNPFSDQAGNTYWSSSSNPVTPDEAWVVRMFDGGLSGAAKAGILPAWPVSGPDLVPPGLTIAQGDMTTRAASQAISGTAETGSTVSVTVNGGVPIPAVVSGANWSLDVGPLSAGPNTIVVTAADFSENQATASIHITLDNAAPALTFSQFATPTNKPTQTIGGTVETGATVAVTKGAATLPVTVNGSSWSALVTGLTAGVNNITVTATDAVGNVATQTANITFAAPDGMVTGGSSVTINDALRTLRIAIGIITPTIDDLIHGDVAPVGAPDDRIDVSDVLLILRKAVGLSSF